jgi:hypothetical protein
VTPGRRQLAIWTLLVVILATATIWRARSNAAPFFELAPILPKDVSVLVALTTPPEETTSAGRFRQSQIAIVSYLFDGFRDGGAIESLRQVGIDDTRPILAGATGRLGLAPQQMRQSLNRMASIPQNWFLLVPVDSLTELTRFFAQSRGASVSADPEGALGTIRFQSAQPTFAFPADLRQYLKSATGDELPSHSEIYYAPVGESYVVLSTSRACLQEGLGKRNGISNWQSLVAELQAKLASHRGNVHIQVNPSLFPEWKSLTGSAFFTENSIRVSIDAEVGAALATALAPRTLSFPLQQERRASEVELYFELAPEHVEEAASSSFMESLASKLFRFDEEERESFGRFQNVIARLAAPSRAAEAAQLFFTRGRLGSPGWVLALPADRAKAHSIATELQREFFVERARHDTAELIERMPPDTKAALSAQLGVNRFYVPLAQVLAGLRAEAADLRALVGFGFVKFSEIQGFITMAKSGAFDRCQKWGDYAVELETGQVNAAAPPTELSREPYREQIDGVTIEYLTPPLARSATPAAETKDARRNQPSFCFDDTSGRLFFGDAPESLRHALTYARSSLNLRRLTEPHHQTLARIACDVRTSAEHSIALDDKEWLTWMIHRLARIGAQTVEGDLKLADRRMTLSLTLSLR